MTRKGHALSSEGQGGYLGLSGGIVLICLALVSLGLAGCATSPGTTSAQPDEYPPEILRAEAADSSTGDKGPRPAPGMDPSSIEGRWGIQILGVRLSGGDSMLDFRFRVLDPDKALPLTNPNRKPYLIDQASGAKLMAPSPPKVGTLRRTIMVHKPKADRTYLILFSNSGRPLQAGSKVTVVIGDFLAQNLVVE